MNVNRKDLVAGILFAGFGVFVAAYAWSNLALGTAIRMGPGYFPLILGLLLLALGVYIAVRSFAQSTQVIGQLPWRAVVILGAVPILFGLTAGGLGLGPTVFLGTFLASLARRGTRLTSAAVVALLMSVFCIVVFVYGLGISAPIFGHWIVD